MRALQEGTHLLPGQVIYALSERYLLYLLYCMYCAALRSTTEIVTHQMCSLQVVESVDTAHRRGSGPDSRGVRLWSPNAGCVLLGGSRHGARYFTSSRDPRPHSATAR